MRILLFSILLACSVAQGSFDSRFFPIYPRSFERTLDKPSSFYLAPVFVRARHARLPYKEGGLQELYKYTTSGGVISGYNLYDVDQALAAAGQINSQFPSEYYSIANLFFAADTSINAEGFQVAAEVAVNDYVSFGFVGSVLHTASSFNFALTGDAKSALGIKDPNTTLQGLERDVQNGYLNTYNMLGLQAPEWSDTGIGNTDVYMRLGKRSMYAFKFRRIDGGARFGLVTPTSAKRNYNNPASISFGAETLGFFAMPELELELKQDWIFGLWLRFEGHLSKTMFARAPIRNEPLNYGVATGQFLIKPGFTYGFSPYAKISDFVDGLGLQAQYVYVHHAQDSWQAQQIVNNLVPETTEIERLSTWTDSHLGVTLLVDLNKTRLGFTRAPELSLEVLVPVGILSPRYVAKSLKISLATEFSF